MVGVSASLPSVMPVVASKPQRRHTCSPWWVWAPSDSPALAKRFKRLSKLIHGQPVYVGHCFRYWLALQVEQAEAECRKRGIAIPDDEPGPGVPFTGVPERAQIDVDE